MPFSRELWIEREDFMEDPPKKFFRLAPGREVRLRYAYLITCQEVVKNDAGEIVELRCTYDPATRGGDAPDGRKVQGTIHWVSAARGVNCEVRLYDKLFTVPDPEGQGEDVDFTSLVNPESLVVKASAVVEPSVLSDPPGSRYQFERTGYFVKDHGLHVRYSTVPSLSEHLGKVKGVTFRDIAGTKVTRQLNCSSTATSRNCNPKTAKTRKRHIVPTKGWPPIAGASLFYFNRNRREASFKFF